MIGDCHRSPEFRSSHPQSKSSPKNALLLSWPRHDRNLELDCMQHEVKMINLADDAHMRGLETLAEEFYENILRPEEGPGFVSDEASLLDISLAPEELLISRIKTHYSKTVTGFDLRKSFWVLLTDLNNGRTQE